MSGLAQQKSNQGLRMEGTGSAFRSRGAFLQDFRKSLCDRSDSSLLLISKKRFEIVCPEVFRIEAIHDLCMTALAEGEAPSYISAYSAIDNDHR